MVCHWEDSDAVIQEMFANVSLIYHYQRVYL